MRFAPSLRVDGSLDDSFGGIFRGIRPPYRTRRPTIRPIESGTSLAQGQGEHEQDGSFSHYAVLNLFRIYL